MHLIGSFQIREGGSADRSFVVKTLSGMMWPLLPPQRRDASSEANTESITRAHVEFVLNLDGAVVLIAESEVGHRVGVLLMTERTHLFTGVSEAFVHYLFVAREWRRDGVGEKLLREAEQVAVRLGYSFLNLEAMVHNQPMRALVSSLGYQEEYLGYRKPLQPIESASP